MNIPSSIRNSLTKSPMDNQYFYNGSEMWERLCAVRDKQIPFVRQDMSMLANVVELYYKGLIISSGIKVDPHLLNASHSLLALTIEIENRIMLLSAPLTRTEDRDRRNFLNDLSNMYIGTRYNGTPASYDDFVVCMDWAQKQINLIKETLLPQINQDIDYVNEYD